jgi:hypothetical protein
LQAVGVTTLERSAALPDALTVVVKNRGGIEGNLAVGAHPANLNRSFGSKRDLKLAASSGSAKQ